ncbi:MAG: phospholipid carrier-dependent glycosyltransferase [Nitrospirota bacterium]
MIPRTVYNGRYLLIILAFGLIVISSNLDFSAVTHEEARNILTGRHIMNGRHCPLNLYVNGTSIINSGLAGIGEYVGGLYGARAIGIFFGLALTVVVYIMVNILFPGNFGLIGAALFLFSGTTLHLSKLATYDIAAAFFLGLSFLLILLSGENKTVIRPGFWLLAGVTSFLLAFLIKNITAVFIIPIVIYVFWKNKISDAVIFFLLPLAIFSAMVFFTLPYPPVSHFWGSIQNPHNVSRSQLSIVINNIYRLLVMPYLLAVFGIFHKDNRMKTSLALILLSLMVVVFHLLSGDVVSMNADVIYSIIFLTPVAALGVDCMGAIFSTGISLKWAKPFFTTAVLVVVLIFGFHEFRVIQKKSPDMSPVITFFRENGFDGMTVVVDSANKDPDCVYIYSLENSFPNARFIGVPSHSPDKIEAILNNELPDFFVIEEYYKNASFRVTAGRFSNRNYIFVKNLQISLPWGIEDVLIFKKEVEYE